MRRSIYLLGFSLFLLLPLGFFPIACSNSPAAPAPVTIIYLPATNTSTPTNTPTGSATPTFTITRSPTITVTPTATNSPTNSPTSTPTNGGLVTTLAGSGSPGSTNATGTAASFHTPAGVAVDTAGNVYVVDELNYLIRKITTGAIVTTLAGSAGVTGSTNATGTAALFNYPQGVAMDSSGNVYVADTYNHLIRKITPGGAVTTLAGSAGVTGATNATGTAASFNYPDGVAVDSSGNVYVADYGNNLIRKITYWGNVTTLAGSGSPGSTNATGTAASFNGPTGVAVDSSGNVYVADRGNHLIRQITYWGNVTTLAGSGSPGATNATGTAASFNLPFGIAVDSFGNVFVADSNNNLIRKITTSGVVTTLAGSGSPGSTNATGISASFNQPSGVAVDSSGNVYIADTGNNLIREIQ